MIELNNICKQDKDIALNYFSSINLNIQGHLGSITCMVLGRNETIITGSTDTSIRIWDIKTTQQQFKLSGHTLPITCLSLIKEKIISGSYDKTIKC